MWATERQFVLERTPKLVDWLGFIQRSLGRLVSAEESILRFVITRCTESHIFGEASILHRAEACGFPVGERTLSFVRRPFEKTDMFTAVAVVPTGIGAELGGHAGDSGPVVKLLGSLCDRIITHPNVVNAADLNESPENSLYVEGSILSRLLLGNISIEQVRKNRVLVVIDEHQDRSFTNAAINAVSAARAVYGFDCPRVVRLKPGAKLKVGYSESGRAVGEVTDFEALACELKANRNEFDAVAITSVIDVPPGYHQKYFDARGSMVNPWGGVEAMLTHTISTLFDVPSAHSPMFEAREIANADPGIVDPRMAAEAVSFTFLQCTLKGLHRTPRIVLGAELGRSGLIDVTNISCLVIPDGCIGIATLAALQQGIPVIAIKENKNLMQNDLSILPWGEGQFWRVENYWEAVGVIAAMKAGIVPSSVRRPLSFTRTELITAPINFRLASNAVYTKAGNE